METYRTAQLAALFGIHPNTVRLYEQIGFITPAPRAANGYRCFTGLQCAQIRLLRTALQVEIVQNGVRKTAVNTIKAAAIPDFDAALQYAQQYFQLVQAEQQRAEEGLYSAQAILHHSPVAGPLLGRKQAADALGITIDTLRNWEMNGLLQVKRRQNGYRVYTPADLRLLRVIRSLRYANFSIAAILRMMGALSQNPDADLRTTLDTPQADDAISACDKLLTSLRTANTNAQDMLLQLRQMQACFS